MKYAAILISFLFLISCDGPKAKENDKYATKVRDAIGIQNAEDVWRCAGLLPKKEYEYIAAAVQKTVGGAHMLMVAYVVLESSGEVFSQNYMIMKSVNVKKTSLIYKDEYYLPNTAQAIANFNFSTNEAYLNSKDVSDAPMTINCTKASITITP